MIVDDLIRQPVSWLSMKRSTGVVISTRLRLARNIEGSAFPEWAGEDECARLCGEIVRAFGEIEAFQPMQVLEMNKLSPLDREILKERHMISREFVERKAGSALVVGAGGVAMMINEEDHLRGQVIMPGLRIEEAWDVIRRLDLEIEKRVRYAFRTDLGFLTACPTNVGTGLRVSVMVHLPGLRLKGEVEAVVKALDRMGMAVRGIEGEGTDASGDMYQISNQTTLGESEESIIARLTRTVKEVVTHETNARARLVEDEPWRLLDEVGRAYGILTHARMISSGEAIDRLSLLKLGIEMGVVRNLSAASVNEIILVTHPGHLQKVAGKLLDPIERDEHRAGLIRRRLQSVVVEERVER